MELQVVRTFVFRHDENATEEQRYFFTREAWHCDPEGETEKDRTYTLILPPMGCFDNNHLTTNLLVSLPTLTK